MTTADHRLISIGPAKTNSGRPYTAAFCGCGVEIDAATEAEVHALVAAHLAHHRTGEN